MGNCEFGTHKQEKNSTIKYKDLDKDKSKKHQKNGKKTKRKQIVNLNEKRKKKKNININQNIFHQLSEIFENYKELPKEITGTNIEFILNSLKGNFLFTNLNDTEFEEIISNMFYGEIKKEKYIFSQNDKASCFFVIESGKFSVEINGIHKKVLKRGESFGELALLYNAPRSASLKALTKCTFWGIQRSTFKKILKRMNNKENSENIKIIESIKVFEGMTQSQKKRLSNNIITLKYTKGKVIVNKGDQADSYFIIKKGRVGCYEDERLVRELEENESFGEQALYKHGLRSLTVRAEVDTECLALSRETLVMVLGSDIKTILVMNSQKWAFENNEVLEKLNDLQIYKVIKNMEVVYQEDYCVLEKEGESIENFYIVLQGEIVYGDLVYKKGEIFGVDFIFPDDKSRELMFDVVSKNAQYSFLSIAKFFSILGQNKLGKVFEKNDKIIKKNELNVHKDFRNGLENLKLNDFFYLKNLGEGQFGDVTLISEKIKKENRYALKTISKSKIACHSIEQNIINEKEILQIINFPLIIRMYKTFKDKNGVHFLFNVIYGLDLFDMIRQIDLLDNTESRFYIGSMLLCLEYLHSNNIIYRDLKPENTMIDKNGILQLIDMGTAKVLNEKNPRTFTILGTPHYMAPEIIQGKGYSFLIDLWALGICMFEFQCGYVPFGEEEEDPYEIYRLIVQGEYEFPHYFSDLKHNKDAICLINVLLNKIPEARLNGGSYTTLKGHVWFDDFDWNGLLDKSFDPPYRPPSVSVSDDYIEELIAEKRDLVKFLDHKYKNQVVRKTLRKNVINWEKEF